MKKSRAKYFKEYYKKNAKRIQAQRRASLRAKIIKEYELSTGK